MPLLPPTDKQARVIWLALTGLALAMIVGLIVALVWGLGKVLGLLSPVLWPLAVAGVLAYLLDPVVDRFERKGVPRTRAIFCVFALALCLVGGLFGSLVPQIVNEARQLASNIPGYVTRVQTRVETWVNHPPELVRKYLRLLPAAPAGGNPGEPANPDNQPPPTAGDTGAPTWNLPGFDQDALRSATGWLAKLAPQLGSWLFGQVTKVAGWFGVLAGLALIPVYLFYFLLEKRRIQSNWTQYLPLAKSELRDEVAFVLGAINDYLIAFFRGQVLVAICDGVLYTLGFVIIGLPYAVLVGAMATVLTMIPFLGAITTCVAALVIALVQFGDWQHPLLVLGVFGIVQSLEGLVISPKIMGDRVGLHPLTIIIAVMVGTTLLGGILGGVLAIPLTAALRVLMFRYVWKSGNAGARAGA